MQITKDHLEKHFVLSLNYRYVTYFIVVGKSFGFCFFFFRKVKFIA